MPNLFITVIIFFFGAYFLVLKKVDFFRVAGPIVVEQLLELEVSVQPVARQIVHYIGGRRPHHHLYLSRIYTISHRGKISHEVAFAIFRKHSLKKRACYVTFVKDVKLSFIFLNFLRNLLIPNCLFLIHAVLQINGLSKYKNQICHLHSYTF